MSEVWTAFEHHIWKNLKESGLDLHDNFILAVSGGLDSMALLEVFLKLKPKAKLKVAYFHHGPSEDKILIEYRDRARDFLKHKISGLKNENISFFTEESQERLATENEMRNSRWQFLKSLMSSDEVLVTAHHLDDRLETLLLKMIRGTSIDGFLSFKMWNQEIFRPFLETSKTDILSYSQKQGVDWIEDPSNKDEHYLRNWIREKWLKDLDAKVISGRENLAKSLYKIGQYSSENQTLELVCDPRSESIVLSRQWYVSLSKADQLRSLALFLKKHQIYTFTSGQLEEIRKRLDKNQKDITFELLGKKWVIKASQIMLQ